MPFIVTMFIKIKMRFLALLKSGIDLKKSTKKTSAIDAKKIIKIITAIILSNIFFFMLFSSPNVSKQKINSADEVEVIIEGELMTSFSEGKDVLLTQTGSGIKVRAKLLTLPENQNLDDKKHYLVLTSIADAHKVLGRPLNWNILPYLKDFTLRTPKRQAQEIDHEIHF